MPDFDLDAALSAPSNPDRNRTGQCVCGVPKNFDDAYCPACMKARCGPVDRARRRLQIGAYSRQGAKDFAVWMWSKVGMGYHPDTSIDDYINLETGDASFSHEEADSARTWLDEAWRAANDLDFDIYEVSMDAQETYAEGILRAAGKPYAGLTLPELWQGLCELGDPQGPPN